MYQLDNQCHCIPVLSAVRQAAVAAQLNSRKTTESEEQAEEFQLADEDPSFVASAVEATAADGAAVVAAASCATAVGVVGVAEEA